MKRALGIALLALSVTSTAEQSVKIEDYTVHYSVVNSTFLTPEVAEKYEIVRSSTRAICTISILDKDKKAYETDVSGSFKNLLGQTTSLKFKTIKDGEAIYAIANFRFTPGEQLSFEVELKLPSEKKKIEFKQRLY